MPRNRKRSLLGLGQAYRVEGGLDLEVGVSEFPGDILYHRIPCKEVTTVVRLLFLIESRFKHHIDTIKRTSQNSVYYI